ncbi:MAG: hypothetical protein M1834_001774 [Cirrosporium novae-zelandiae]|nr:MAG: hypothetical protein M1834_001774 [Cirrosporium novae-zelandiae]
MERASLASSIHRNRTTLEPPQEVRRRQSMPPPNRRPSSNYVNVQPASPEVITSLISSLSSISTPFHEHFEQVPHISGSRSTPSSPGPVHSEFSSISSGAGGLLAPIRDKLGMEHGAYRNKTKQSNDYLSEWDDAAIPPVVRISKPSGLSSPSSRERSPLLRSPSRNSLSWKAKEAAREEARDQDDSRSIGNVSVEHTPRASSASSKMGHRTSRRSLRDSFYDKEGDRHHILSRKSSKSSLDSATGFNADRQGGPVKSLSPKLSFAEDIILEGEPLDLNYASGPSGSSTPKISDSSGDTVNPKMVPKRESSLRHSYSGSPASTRRRRQLRRHSSHDLTSASRERSDREESAHEEDGVARRIRELKEQKRRRDEVPPEFAPELVAERSSRTHNRTDRSKRGRRSKSRQSREGLSLWVDESAPSPSIAQGRHRPDIWSRSVSSPLISPTGTMDSSKPMSREHGMKRTNSRNKSTPSPLPGRHRRSYSNPLSPPIEERPSSGDSIDEAVDIYLSSPRLSQKVRNPNTGRVIAFSEVGDPNGFVVFCCVGMGLTRYLMAFYDELAATLKLRLITLDRPGVGESQPYADGSGTPLNWPDDVATVCAYLKISKFSLLAHSAGAIYALATALRMPQQIRGRIHLLAPWIPPSQMSVLGSQKDSHPAGNLPYSQRILRALPTPFLKAANSSFMSATSASITSSLPKSPRRVKRKSVGPEANPTNIRWDTLATGKATPKPPIVTGVRDSVLYPDLQRDDQDSPLTHAPNRISTRDFTTEAMAAQAAADAAARERQAIYDMTLTHQIWDLATTNANPAVDLIICLERRQTIGFRYVDITRAVVIHHGSKDTRVPAENVKWLGSTMRRCEVRILEGEGHGLMASAKVMGEVLMEIAKEWEDWTTVVTKKRSDGR